MPRWPALTDEVPLLLTAIQYFTRVPVPRVIDFSQDRLDRSMRYFPLIGVLVGGAMALGFDLTSRLWPSSVAVAIVISLGVLMTGGLHEDGLADFCDAFFAGRDRDTTLAIMKDPHLGSYGVLGLVLTLLIRFAVLVALSPAIILPGLIAAHAFSRLMALAAMQSLDYVRGRDAAIKPGRTVLGWFGTLMAGSCGLLPLVMLGWRALAAAGLAMSVSLVIGWICRRKIGGYTGDCLGAIQQLSEIAFYLGLLA
jgi:adenosylcobinamide-GDP ribazoletransferase